MSARDMLQFIRDHGEPGAHNQNIHVKPAAPEVFGTPHADVPVAVIQSKVAEAHCTAPRLGVMAAVLRGTPAEAQNGIKPPL